MMMINDMAPEHIRIIREPGSNEMPTSDQEVITIEQAAKKLRISRNHAYKAAQTGEIPTIKIGKRILVPVAALENKLKNSVDLSDQINGQAVKQLKKRTERALQNHIKYLETHLSAVRAMLVKIMTDG